MNVSGGKVDAPLKGGVEIPWRFKSFLHFVPKFFQRLEEVKIKSRVYSDYDNSLMVGLSVTYLHPRVIKELSGGKRFIEIRESDRA